MGCDCLWRMWRHLEWLQNAVANAMEVVRSCIVWIQATKWSACMDEQDLEGVPAFVGPEKVGS
jgi:hypothetical protein